jgi:hypothetical protein
MVEGLCAVASNVYHRSPLSCVLLLRFLICVIAIISNRNSYRGMLFDMALSGARFIGLAKL